MAWQRVFDFKASIDAQNITANTNGRGVDLKGYVNSGGREIKAYLNAKRTGADADETLDVKVQESDDNSTFTDIAGAVFSQVAGANQAEEAIHFRTNKRYVRLVATVGGTTPAFDVFGGFLLERRLT